MSRADHYRIVGEEGLSRRSFNRLYQARIIARFAGLSQVAAMSRAGKVLRYHPADPKAKT